MTSHDGCAALVCEGVEARTGVTGILLDAVGRHGHLAHDGTVQGRLLTMRAATIDRALADIRAEGRRFGQP